MRTVLSEKFRFMAAGTTGAVVALGVNLAAMPAVRSIEMAVAFKHSVGMAGWVSFMAMPVIVGLSGVAAITCAKLVGRGPAQIANDYHASRAQGSGVVASAAKAALRF